LWIIVRWYPSNSITLFTVHFSPFNWGLASINFFINFKYIASSRQPLFVFCLCQVQADTGSSAAGQPTPTNSNASALGTWADPWCESSSIEDDYYNAQRESWWHPGVPICLYTGNASLKWCLECAFFNVCM
jgi:hypothetical protein